jgi:hypothetical protein
LDMTNSEMEARTEGFITQPAPPPAWGGYGAKGGAAHDKRGALP